MANEYISLARMFDDTSEVPQGIIGDGILPQGGMLTISGKQKVGKSFLVMNFAIALIEGRDFAGFRIPQPRNVLMFSAEGGRLHNQERLRKIAAQTSVEARGKLVVCFDSRYRVENDTDFEGMKQKIQEYTPEVVIIDPLVKFHGADENSAQEMARIMGKLRSIIEDHQVAMIVAHHDGKSEFGGMRGSSAIAGEYDSYIQIQKSRGELSLSFELRQSLPLNSRKVIFDDTTFWYRTEQASAIESISAEHPNGISTSTFVKKLVEKENISQATAYRIIKKLKSEGRLVEKDKILTFSNTFTFPPGN